MKKKLSLPLALFTSSLTGVLVGSFIMLNVTDKMPHNENNAIAQVSTYANESVAHRLSSDFINISKTVTPAIVRINSTKIIKQKRANYYSPFQDDPFFKEFFNLPDQKQPKEEKFKQYGLGSGVIVDSKGIVLTNNHVVDGADSIKVVLSDKREYDAKVLGTDAKSDIAVLRLQNAKDLPTAVIGDSSKIEVGEWVLAIGSPFGLSSSVTSGIISAKGRADIVNVEGAFEDFIQTDAAINPGNSGGALVNLNGEIIGINTAIFSQSGGYMGIGFAVPSNMAKKVMTDIIEKGHVSRGFIGIGIQDLNEGLAKNLKLKDSKKGIVVSQVQEDSPAQKAGLKPYDVILKLNDKNIFDSNSFRNNIASIGPDKEVSLNIWRDAKEIIVKVKLGELKDNKIASKSNDSQITDNKLGFFVNTLTPDIARQLNLNPKTKGIFVTDVSQDSNAFESGLRKFDIIEEINRNKINSVEDFNKVIKEIKSGDSVVIQVSRENGRFLLAFTYQ